jgi:2-acylglycerol O-acyltransferase 2
MISVNSASIENCLKNFNSVAICVGGSEEAFHSKPGKYKFVVKNRKGFVKIALKTGSSLVPVISFGENEVFEPIENKHLMILQKAIKSIFGIVLPFVKITEKFPLLPKRLRITTVVGSPIEVVKILSPTQLDIDNLHEKFLNELEILFNSYKEKYLKNDKNITLKLI